MKPKVKFLDKDLIENIIYEAYEVLEKIGIEVHNKNVIELLMDNGCKEKEFNGKKRILIYMDVINKALSTVPSSFKLYDVLGNETCDLGGDRVVFNPGSTALSVLDRHTNKVRRGTENDYIEHCKVISQLDNIKLNSTAIIPNDIDEKYADAYRLYLSLLHTEKPVVTGCFSVETFEFMKDMQLAVRGDEDKLREKPLCIFSICPTSPLKWSEVTSQNLIDCARYGIPVEFISMPLSGFMAPVTLVGTLIQHTAETLSGVIIGQLARKRTPMLYGGSPASFDIRYETTPMGAIETQMIDVAYNEIGKEFEFPTQAYISFSDSKQFDVQAGQESGMGAMLAALGRINSISGPGMLDFESCQSLQKLVYDNEICGMVYRMIEGIKPKEDFPAIPIFERLLTEGHLLIDDHTRKHLKKEHYFPSEIVDRKNLDRWKADGSESVNKRCNDEIDIFLKTYKPTRLSDDILMDISGIMDCCMYGPGYKIKTRHSKKAAK